MLFSVCCGPGFAESLGPGTYTRYVEAAGLTRHFIIHVPKSYNGQTTPLVFNFHGSGQDAIKQEFITKMDETSNADGFIVVYPDAVAGHWNDGCTATEYIYRGHFGDCIFFEIFGGGHTWPGGRIVAPSQLGPTDEALNANDQLWKFFSRYSLP